MEISEKLAQFIAETEYGNLSSQAVDAAKKDLLDFVGCALLGGPTALGTILKAYLEDIGGAPQCTVIGLNLKTSRPNAAFADGALGHTLDYDNNLGYEASRNGAPVNVFVGHLSSPVLPAALTVGESLHVDGRSLLTSYVLGLEVACRVGAAVQPSLSSRGFHSTPTLGIFGAAAAAGKLLQLGSEELAAALGIAASESAGLSESFGSMTKPVQVGRAAEGGVVAAQLAQRGCTATKTIFAGPLGGFCPAVADQYYLASMTQDLPPVEWAVSNVRWKKYPSCAETHPAIEAAIAIAQEHRIDEAEVASIELGFTPAYLLRLLRQVDRIPRTSFEAKFSIQFCVAVGLLEGAFGPEQVTEANVHDPRVTRLINKVKPLYAHRDFYTSPERYTATAKEGLPPFAVIVTVKLRDGQEYTRRVLAVNLPEQEVVAKFRRNALAVLPTQTVEQAIDLILHLETLNDVTRLIEHLQPIH